MVEGESQEVAANQYTFGDNPRASARLRRLAEMYEPESRDLLRRSGINAPGLAVDLGCGPGWLTHLRSLGEVLAAWAGVAAPRGLLVVHETESLEASHPALRLDYRLLEQLQRHHGQTLQVGAVLENGFAGSGWRLVESQRRLLERPAADMAELHLANLQTWRDDEYARRAFDSDEIAALETSLGRIVSRRDGGVVVNAARQIIAQRG